jgi:cytochrome c-type biogenesis protein CcmH/NrfG
MDHKALELGVEVVRAGIQASPASAKLLTLLGVLLIRSGDMAKGQKAFQEAQQLSPESGLGRIGLASTLMQMGLAADAAQVLREQLAIGGPDPKTELTLARALLLKDSSLDEKHQAAALLKRVLKEEPANAAAHGLLGKVYIQLGDIHNEQPS